MECFPTGALVLYSGIDLDGLATGFRSNRPLVNSARSNRNITEMKQRSGPATRRS